MTNFLSLMLLLSVTGSEANSVAQAVSGNWPGWRGDGSGVSQDAYIPKSLSEECIRWKTAIPYGVSSPIIWQDRCLITSAVNQTKHGIPHEVILSLALASLFTLSAFASVTIQSADIRAVALQNKWLNLFDIAVSVAAIVCFFSGICLMFWTPEYFEPGNYTVARNHSGTIMLIGFVAAFGMAAPYSAIRLVGAASLVAATMWVFIIVDDFKSATTSKVVFIVCAAFAVAAWWCTCWFATSISGSRSPTRHPTKSCFVCIAMFLATALLQFVSTNILKPTSIWVGSVQCYLHTTGELLWERSASTIREHEKHSENSYATPTPVTDGQYVVSHFGSSVVCMDMDGREVWKREMPNYANTQKMVQVVPL